MPIFYRTKFIYLESHVSIKYEYEISIKSIFTFYDYFKLRNPFLLLISIEDNNQHEKLSPSTAWSENHTASEISASVI